MSPHKRIARGKTSRQGGFTLIETMVSIAVLTIGLLSVAALMSHTADTSAHSRYMSTASMLASEKLEDLSRFPSTNPALTAGTYTDVVQISSDEGIINETTSTGGVSTLYTQTPGGTITVTPGAGLPAATSTTLTFNRTWTIVANTPVAGVNQITVLVTLANTSLQPPVTFQMSMVHP
jgi:prepilin-type N-terminal cleavage/methylation domain-containing protein